MAVSISEGAWADQHYDAKQLQSWVEQGRIMPLESIIEQHPSLLEGKMVDVELERKRGRFVYEIKVLTHTGMRREIYFDASTGAPLRSDEDSDDNHNGADHH